MHQDPPRIGSVLQLIPRLMALFVVLPLLLGLAWMTWSVTRDTLRVQREWIRVEARVVDASSRETIRLAITRGGASQQVELARSSEFRSLMEGEVFSAYQHPADPRSIKRGGGAGLWGGAVVLASFTLVLGGVFLYLMRVKPGVPVLPAPDSEDPGEEDPEPEDPLARFRRPGSRKGPGPAG